MPVKLSDLKKIREAAGLTMQEVVDHLSGCGFDYSGRAIVGKWEQGSRPPYEVAKHLATLYKVCLDDIYAAPT